MAHPPKSTAAAESKVARLAACIVQERSATIARLGHVLPGADAEDAFQEACVRALSRIDSQRASNALRPWFQVILRSVVAARLRKPEGTRALDEHYAEQAESSPPSCCACGADALRYVRASHRSALQRVLLGEQAIADAARADGTTPGNLRIRLHRGKQELRSAWLRICGACITDDVGTDCSCREPRDAPER